LYRFFDHTCKSDWIGRGKPSIVLLLAIMLLGFQSGVCKAYTDKLSINLPNNNYAEVAIGELYQINKSGDVLSKGVLDDLGYFVFNSLSTESSYLFKYESNDAWPLDELLIVLVNLEGNEEIVRARKTSTGFFIYDMDIDRISKSPVEKNGNRVAAILTAKQNKKLTKKIKLASLGKLLIINKNWYLNLVYGCESTVDDKKNLIQNKTKGETSKEQLIAFGVSPNKITVNYCPPSNKCTNLNSFQGSKMLIMIPKNELEEIETLTNPDISKLNKNEIVFRIQLLSSKRPIYIAPVNFAGIEDVEEYQESGKYKYISGRTNDYDYARDVLLSDYKRKGFEGAFIIAFCRGEKVPVSSALTAFKEK
jgi:hypothetical protein